MGGSGASRGTGLIRRRAWLIGALLLLGCGQKAITPPETWQAVTIPTDAIFDGIFFTDSLNGWMTGGNYQIPGGIVGRTRDGGRTWQFMSGVVPGKGAGFALGASQFRDTLNGLALGSEGRVLVTADGGVSWTPADGSRGSMLSDLRFLDAWNGWAVGPSTLLRTSDGGESWSSVMADDDYFSGNAIQFLDDSHGWVVSHGGELKSTSDGGRTWTKVALPLAKDERPTLWDVTFTDPAQGWVVGEQGVIFHTDDGGAIWTRQSQGVPIVRVIPKGEPPRPREVVRELEVPPDPLTLTAVRFLDRQRGYAVGSYNDVGESVVIATRDGGATWKVQRVEPGELLRTLFLLDSAHAWAAGDRARTMPQVVLRYTGADR